MHMEDKFREECGIFGVYGHPEAANLTYLGLYALQHRGQEGAGIVSSDGRLMRCEKGLGLVSDIFNVDRIASLKGHNAIGHNRYSTTGASHMLENVQPMLVNYGLGSLSIAHNGNLTNYGILKDELEAYGSIFHSTIDSELIVHLMALSKGGTLVSRAVDALSKVQGAYSLLIMNEKEMIGVRDPHGFRPLCLGMLDGAYVLSSETCALDLIQATYIRDIEPGELVLINENGVESFKPFHPERQACCVFEYIYFSRPDSYVFGENVNYIRKMLGRQLAIDNPVEADLVVPVPDSGVPAALGYAEQSGIPFDVALIRNHYVGRTFIEPQQSIRHFGVKIKLNPVKRLLQGKRVVLVDDSIVRGTTSRKLVKMVRQAGAKEVHMRISSPPTTHPCFYGIDTPTRQELIAATHSIDEIRKYITADSLGYLTIDGLLGVIPDSMGKFCTACFNGDYPMPFPRETVQQLGFFEK
ncbi:MAG: amidophosphoribosyltransferase [Nitrospirae bacterium]|nr:amidophosphoribosyltransferase [Nitrospirota bacterium]